MRLKAVAIVLAIKQKFLKYLLKKSQQVFRNRTGKILICPTADHQQEIVSLSEKKERNKYLSLLIPSWHLKNWKYSNFKLGNVNG